MADWIKEKNDRIEKARGPFDAVRQFFHLDIPAWDSRRRAPRAYERVVEAFRAVSEWRYANNQRGQDHELERLAVRICADQFAREIEDAAHAAGQDPATIAWVVAGLRCPARPFCTGCDACFTVSAPHRHDAAFTVTGSSAASGGGDRG